MFRSFSSSLHCYIYSRSYLFWNRWRPSRYKITFRPNKRSTWQWEEKVSSLEEESTNNYCVVVKCTVMPLVLLLLGLSYSMVMILVVSALRYSIRPPVSHSAFSRYTVRSTSGSPVSHRGQCELLYCHSYMKSELLVAVCRVWVKKLHCFLHTFTRTHIY